MYSGLAMKMRWKERRAKQGKDTTRPNLVMSASVYVHGVASCFGAHVLLYTDVILLPNNDNYLLLLHVLSYTHCAYVHKSHTPTTGKCVGKSLRATLMWKSALFHWKKVDTS